MRWALRTTVGTVLARDGVPGGARAGAASAPPARMLRAAVLTALVACATQAPAPPPSGAVARTIAAAAAEAHVPAELLLAIAAEEGGLALPAARIPSTDDHVPVAGALELRHGRLDTLAMGARLLGTTEDALRADTDLATRAGALVVAALGAEHGATTDLASWRPALEALSGMDDANARAYAERVLAILRTGGAFVARDAERIELSPHAVPIALAAPAPASPTPDFPGAQWFTTSCTNKCTAGRPLGHAAVDKIVIHDTEGGWNASVATLQNDANKSVHYIVDADGARVGQFRPETDTTWHAGNFFYNETSIGIEHVGTAANPAGYSTGLYETSRRLVTNIRTRWTVPLDRTHIIGHYQVPDGTVVAESSSPCTALLDTCETSASFGGANNHRDPGYHWEWCQYMQALGGACTCNDAWPDWNCTTDHTEAVRCTNGQVEIEACPNGCDVMPTGTPDVCHTADPLPPDAGVDDDAGATNADAPTVHTGSCATSSGDAGALVLLALLALRRRRA